jgi:hypothetical protein
MAYQISARARQLLDKIDVQPNIILAIDGHDRLFGAEVINVYVTIGMAGLTIGGGWLIGGLIDSGMVDDYISLDGTTTQITQQLDLDKNNATSTQTVKIRLVDIDGEITRLISPGYDLNDILYRNAKLRLGFKDGAYPADYIDLFIGKIQQVEPASGYVDITIAHPDELKRSEIFPKLETTLAADLNYYSAVIQDLTWYQQGDWQGVVEVRYINTPFIGDVANLSVSGNLITVAIDSGVTKASTIREAVINSLQVSSMAVPLISGNKNAVQVTHPTTQLTVGNTVDVEDVTGFLLPDAPRFRTYLRINDEIMEYTGIDTVNNRFTGVTRHVLTSVGNNHEIDDTVSSFYKLGDNTESSNAIDLALQIMLSGGSQYYLENHTNIKFYDFGTGELYPNALLAVGIDLSREHNIQIGDTIQVSGSGIIGNNITATIENFEAVDIGTIIYVTGASFTVEFDSPAVISLSSKYDVLPDGCGFLPIQVDIDRFNLIKARFPSSIPNYEIYLKDTIKPKEFINTDLMLPSALYSIPRQGKASVGISAPPLYDGESRVLGIDTLKNVNNLKTTRSINKYFYNSVIFKYNEDSIDDRALSGRIIYSADSQNRINSPNKPYTINAKGLRPSATNDQLIERNCKRLLQRYQFAAEMIPVEPNYKTGYTIEVGDSVIFGDGEIILSDTSSGTRDFKPRVFEVVNKQFDWRAGKIQLNLVDTNFSSGVRYGTWSPASNVVTGSTTNQIKISPSFGSDSEQEKWTPYFNRTIRVRSQDYNTIYTTKLVKFDDVDEHLMIVSPALPSAPVDGMIVDVPNYDDLNLQADGIYKAVHPFWNVSLTVASASSGTVFTVASGTGSLAYLNATVRVHSPDYTRDSGSQLFKISNIAGDVITVSDDLGFTPQAGDIVEMIGFKIDQGAPYAWV